MQGLMSGKANEQEHFLAEAAILAWRLAPSLCRDTSGTTADCLAAHSIWPSLRLLGILGSIETRASHYQNAMRALAARTGVLRVLISGAADHAMLAYVIDACRGAGARCEITVLDLCETPLALSRWYAARVSFPVATTRHDILTFSPPHRFDAICTDSFIGRFPATAWPALFAKWRALLQPGGVVITVNALRGTDTPDIVTFSEEESRALGEGVLAMAPAFRNALAVGPLELAQRAEAYARHHVTHAVRSAEDIRSLFEGAGFALDTMRIDSPAGAAPRNLRGPSVRGGRQYLHIIARAL